MTSTSRTDNNAEQPSNAQTIQDVQVLMKMKQILSSIPADEREWTGPGRKGTGQLLQIGAKIPKYLVDELKSLPGRLSHHVERAVKIYLKILKTEELSQSTVPEVPSAPIPAPHPQRKKKAKKETDPAPVRVPNRRGASNTSNDVKIYANPTPDEAQALVNEKKEARFLVDDVTKKVYLWNAEYTHYEALMILREREITKEVGGGLAIMGVAVLTEGRFHALKIHEPEIYADPKIRHPYASKFFITDWSWAYEWLIGLKEDFENNREIFLAKESRT
jgi:hypothetical protein